MDIGKEIKQKIFKNEWTKALINLKYTGLCVDSVTCQCLKPFNLTQPQYNVLRILRGQRPETATVNLITERMLDKSSNVSRIIDKLVAKELVDRCQCCNDRRSVDIVINKEGLKLLKKIDPQMDDAWIDFQDRITNEEAIELDRLLTKLRG